MLDCNTKKMRSCRGKFDLFNKYICLDRQQSQLKYLNFLSTCATFPEIPSNISTMVWAWTHFQNMALTNTSLVWRRGLKKLFLFIKAVWFVCSQKKINHHRGRKAFPRGLGERSSFSLYFFSLNNLTELNCFFSFMTAGNQSSDHESSTKVAI